MINAVFIDYTGTMTKQAGPDVEEMIKRFCKNSDIKDPQQMLKYWWGMVKEFEDKSYLDSYLTEDEIVDQMLQRCQDEIHFKGDLNEMHRLCQKFWMYAPMQDDLKEFFDMCKLPVFIISNSVTMDVYNHITEMNRVETEIAKLDTTMAVV